MSRFFLFLFSGLVLVAQNIDVARMRDDLDVLCSARFEGRLSLTAGSDLAANYIADQFRAVGLRPVAAGASYLQRFPLTAYTPDPAKTTLTLKSLNHPDRTFKLNQDFRGMYWKPVQLDVPVVFVRFGITAPEYGYDDYASVDVQGKAVLLYEHEPGENDPNSIFNGTGHTRYGVLSAKVANALRHGAVAALVASEPDRKHRGFFDAPASTTTPLRANAPRQALEEDSLPVFQVSDSTAAAIRACTGATVELRTAPTAVTRGESSNVAGLLAGSDPKLSRETILITAHYDHLGVQQGRLYPGANDNASGTVAVIELARLFATAKTRPRRSLLFVVFGSEEELMLGSFYYTAHPLRPLATTKAGLNLDMIARDEAHIPQSVGVVEIPADTRNEINLIGSFYSPDLRRVLEDANQSVGLELSTKFDRDHDLNALFRCDHLPFLLKEIPTVWLFAGWHPGYHEPSDTIENLNFDKLRKVTDLAHRAVGALASAPVTPAWKP